MIVTDPYRDRPNRAAQRCFVLAVGVRSAADAVALHDALEPATLGGALNADDFNPTAKISPSPARHLPRPPFSPSGRHRDGSREEPQAMHLEACFALA